MISARAASIRAAPMLATSLPARSCRIPCFVQLLYLTLTRHWRTPGTRSCQGSCRMCLSAGGDHCQGCQTSPATGDRHARNIFQLLIMPSCFHAACSRNRRQGAAYLSWSYWQVQGQQGCCQASSRPASGNSTPQKCSFCMLPAHLSPPGCTLLQGTAALPPACQ